MTAVYASEVARVLGTSRRAVVQLALSRPDFPAAVSAADNARRRWSRSEVLGWAARQPELAPGWNAPTLSAPGDLTNRTRHILDIAARESSALNHDFVGDVHVLLALFDRDCPGAAREALTSSGARLDELCEAVIAQLGKPEQAPVHGRLLDRQTSTLLERATLEAVELRDETVSSEHVLLALVGAADHSAVGGLLAGRGVDPCEVADRVVALTEGDGVAARGAGGDTLAVQAIDAAEAARVLGVSRARLTTLVDRPDFPASEVDAIGHRRWRRRAIIEWAAAHPEVGLPRARLGSQGPATAMPHLDEILRLGCDEAQRLNHSWVGPDHLLLALFREDCPGSARAALTSFGIARDSIREAWVRSMGDPFDPSGRPLVVPPGTHHILERARLHATRLEDDEVLSEHVLLALTEQRSAVQKLLGTRGADRAALRARLVAVSDGMLPAPMPPPLPTWHPPAPKRVPRPPELDLARSPLGHDPRRRKPWGSGVFSTKEGKTFTQGIALRQYRIDRDGYPVLTTDGKPIHGLIDEDGRDVLDEHGCHIDTVVNVPPGALMHAYPKE